MNPRSHSLERKTRETRIALTLNLDGTGDANIQTNIGFLDHLLTTLTVHARFDLELTCEGDLHIDDHHTAEDCALAIGTAILGPSSSRSASRDGLVTLGVALAQGCGVVLQPSDPE